MISHPALGMEVDLQLYIIPIYWFKVNLLEIGSTSITCTLHQSVCLSTRQSATLYCCDNVSILFIDVYLQLVSAELGEPLQKYIANTWPDGVVKYVRRPTRGGLIVARHSGAEAATGDVLVFLDAHCEVNHGWYINIFFTRGGIIPFPGNE